MSEHCVCPVEVYEIALERIKIRVQGDPKNREPARPDPEGKT